MATTLAVLGTIAGLGTAAGSVGSLFGPKDDTKGYAANSMNPAVRQLNYLFGRPTVTSYSSRGAPATWLRGIPSGDVFGTGLKDTISQFLADPRAMVPGSNTPLWESIYGTGDQFAESMRRFRSGMEGAVGTAAELTQTGLPTDPMPYFNEAVRLLGTNVLPQLAETSGFGTQGTGYAQKGFNAAGDLFGQAALSGIDLAEAATNRRMQAAPLLATLLASEQSVPINIGTMLSDVSTSEQLRPVSLFQSLMASGANQGPFSVPGYNPIQSGPGYGAAAAGLGSVLNSLGSFDWDFNASPTSSANSFDPTNNALLRYGGDEYLTSQGIFSSRP